eukprot:Skav229301  [mRNA]  locus=scaffold544:287143:298234:+ [translate_table: standard]
MDGINEGLVEQVEAPVEMQRPSEEIPANATKADSNLPTCYFLATAGTKTYEGDFHWMIELEKGWSAWMPGNEPFDGCTDQPLRYTLGRYDFEVHFETESSGIQTNLTTGKVRRIQRLQKGESAPAWEGTGVRRRPAGRAQGAPAGASLNAAPQQSAAQAAQANRTQRRQGGGYTAPAPAMKVADSQRPSLSQAAYKPGTAGTAGTAPAGDRYAVPRYMRPLKGKA